MIVRVIRRANGVLGFQDVNFDKVTEDDFRSKDRGEAIEDYFRQQYQEMFPKHEIKHVWCLGDEERFDTEEDFKEALAKELGLLPRSYDYDSPIEATLDAAAAFVQKGYVEAEPIAKLMDGKLAANGKPILCQWCNRLHWSKEHEEEQATDIQRNLKAEEDLKNDPIGQAVATTNFSEMASTIIKKNKS